MTKFKSLSKYKLPKGKEISYIKKFVNGVTKEEFAYMFLDPGARMMFDLAIANIGIGIATKSLRENKLI